MAGIIVFFFGFAAQAGEPEGLKGPQPQPQTEPQTQRTIKGGGVVLIGPIPIIFGSDAKTAAILIILALVLIITVALLFYF